MLSDDFSLFSYDYDDKADAQDADAAFRKFEALCSARLVYFILFGWSFNYLYFQVTTAKYLKTFIN